MVKSVGRWAILFLLFAAFLFLSYSAWHAHVYWAGESILKQQLLTPADVASLELAASMKPTIPRILHQTYKTNDTAAMPEAWHEAQQSCQSMHPDWEYKFWTDESARDFLAREYAWFLPTFEAYPFPIQRVDAVRYFLLYHYGGVYLDLDIGCKKDMSPLTQFAAVLAKTAPIGVSNDMMASAARHPLFDDVIHSLAPNAYSRGTKYPTVFFSTGPMFLNTRLLEYLKQIAAAVRSTGKETAPAATVRILPPELYGSAPDSFFRHYAGSSWHGSDADTIKYVARNKSWFISAVGVVAACLAIYYIVKFIRFRLGRKARDAEKERSAA